MEPSVKFFSLSPLGPPSLYTLPMPLLQKIANFLPSPYHPLLRETGKRFQASIQLPKNKYAKHVYIRQLLFEASENGWIAILKYAKERKANFRTSFAAGAARAGQVEILDFLWAANAAVMNDADVYFAAKEGKHQAALDWVKAHQIRDSYPDMDWLLYGIPEP